MWWVVSILGLFIYPMVGHLLDILTEKEVIDDTPSSKFSLFKKMIRVLIFPCSYKNWEKRYENIGEEGLSFLYHYIIRRGGLSISGRDKFIFLSRTFWPLKILPFMLGFIMIIIYLVIIMPGNIIGNTL